MFLQNREIRRVINQRNFLEAMEIGKRLTGLSSNSNDYSFMSSNLNGPEYPVKCIKSRKTGEFFVEQGVNWYHALISYDGKGLIVDFSKVSLNHPFVFFPYLYPISLKEIRRRDFYLRNKRNYCNIPLCMQYGITSERILCKLLEEYDLDVKTSEYSGYGLALHHDIEIKRDKKLPIYIDVKGIYPFKLKKKKKNLHILDTTGIKNFFGQSLHRYIPVYAYSLNYSNYIRDVFKKLKKYNLSHRPKKYIDFSDVEDIFTDKNVYDEDYKIVENIDYNPRFIFLKKNLSLFKRWDHEFIEHSCLFEKVKSRSLSLESFVNQICM